MSERLNKENFDDVVKNTKTAIVDFYSDSCVPCKKLNSILSDFEENKDGKVKIFKININFDMEIAERFDVMSTPTLVLLENGIEVGRKTGVQSLASLEEWLGL